MSFVTTVRASIASVESVTLEGDTFPIKSTVEFAHTYQDGTADGKANNWHKDQRSLAAGSEVLDLTALSGGTAARKAAADNFTIVKTLIIENTTADGTAGYLRVGGNGTTPWEGAGSAFQAAGGKIDIPPGGILIWAVREGATTSSANNLKIEAVTNTMTYNIFIGGES